MTKKKSFPSDNLYIGFDQSLADTGIALYRQGKILIANLRTDRSRTTGERLLDIESHVEPLLSLQPTAVFYEYAFRVNESIKIWGLFEKMLAQVGCSTICFRTQAKENGSWRKRIGVSSRKRELQDKLGLSKHSSRGIQANNNASDAVGILAAGLLAYRVFQSFDEICQLPIIKSHVRGKVPNTLLHEIDHL